MSSRVLLFLMNFWLLQVSLLAELCRPGYRHPIMLQLWSLAVAYDWGWRS